MDDGKHEKLLTAILEELRLLTVGTKAQALKRFQEEFLTSDLRRQMYEAFDGERTLPQISESIGCKVNTLQVFAQSLVEKDLVSYEMRGGARIISKSLSKVATHFAEKMLEVSNG